MDRIGCAQDSVLPFSPFKVVTGGVPQGPEPPEVPSLREAPLGVASELLRPQALRDIAAALPSKLQVGPPLCTTPH